MAPGAKVALFAFVLSNPGIGEVVRRTRGRLLVLSDQDTVVESQIGTLGMAVVTDASVAIGATALPGPVTELDDDIWFLWEPFLDASDTMEAAATGIIHSQDFDSKAMRRVEEGRSVIVMVENASAVFTLTIQVAMSMLTSRIG